MKNTFAQITQEYVEADEALMAFVRSPERGGETRHVDLAEFERLEAARDAAHAAYRRAWQDPSTL